MFRVAGSKRLGFIIIAIFFFTLITSVVGVVAVSLVSRELDGIDMMTSSSKAFFISTAGIEYAKEALSTDSNWSDNVVDINKNFAGGSFAVTFSDQEPSSITVESVGIYGDCHRQAVQSVCRVEKAFEYCMYSGKSINIVTIRSIDADLATGNIVGDIAAENHANISDGINHAGTVDEDLVGFFPSVDDYDYWKNMAVEQGQYVVGDKTFEDGGSYEGVWYVTGNATIGNVNFIHGTVISEGNVFAVMTATTEITAPSGMPAIVTQQSFHGGASFGLTINGLLYAEKLVNINLAILPAVNGAIIAGNNINMVGVAGLNYIYNGEYMRSLNNFSSSLSVVGINSDWKEL